MIAELRFMENDHIQIDFLARERRHEREPHHRDLHDYLKEYQKNPKNYDADAKYPCGLDTLPPFGRRSWPIVDYLSQVRLYGSIFTYFSRFPGSLREEMARVFEKLQYQICERQDYLLYWLYDRPGPPPRPKLDSFRLAQKIRNEQGYSLDYRPQICFRSFEDLVQLERSIEANEVVNFLLQGVALEASDTDVVKYSWYYTRNLPQLDALHDGATQIDPGYWDRDTVIDDYGWQFRYLTRGEGGVKPSWREVKKYLRITSKIGNGANMLCGADILYEELDEALNCLLNNCVRLRHGHSENDVRFLKQLLDRGASLWFRGADERSYSIAALLDCVRYLYGYFRLSEFSSYICCPLFHEYGCRGISFDSRRLASLCCLAARNIPRSKNASELPPGLRSFIEAHQELQLQLG